MMQCRMCSQHLTRPGKLCRECEHELNLERARLAGASVGEPAEALPMIDAARMAETADGAGRRAQLRSRGAVMALAFTIGLAGAAGLRVAQQSSVSATPGSVMLDRDISRVRPRSLMPATTHATGDRPVTYDRVLAYSDALSRCSGETLFPRIACEERARVRYCDGAVAQLPQCAGELPHDRGL